MLSREENFLRRFWNFNLTSLKIKVTTRECQDATKQLIVARPKFMLASRNFGDATEKFILAISKSFVASQHFKNATQKFTLATVKFDRATPLFRP